MNSPYPVRSTALAVAVVVAAALGVGCGERAEPLGDLAQPYPVSVRGAGERPTALKAPPKRIVALDLGSAELLIALGAGERLVGVPAGELPGRPPAAAEVVRAAGQVKVDAVAHARPDLIVATPSTDPVDIARAQRETGAAVYVQPAASIADVRRGAVELGFLLGKAPRARRVAGSIGRKVAQVEDRLVDVEPVAVFVDTGFFITVPKRSLLGDLVARASGRSVAGPNPGPAPFNPCEVLRLRATVLLVVSAREPRTRATVFGKCKGRGADIRVASLSPALVMRAGPRVGEALEAIARALHPDAFG
jgi:iron complex transport system substrate-binding protein